MRLSVGDRVVVCKAIDLAPHATIPAGETGVVVSIDLIETWIELDGYYPGLVEWRNCIWLTGDDTRIIADSLCRACARQCLSIHRTQRLAQCLAEAIEVHNATALQR